MESRSWPKSGVKAGGIEQSGRLEVGGDLHDLVVGPAEARALIDSAPGAPPGPPGRAARWPPGRR
jgi:hypothetical protein